MITERVGVMVNVVINHMHLPYMYGDSAALFLLGMNTVKCLNRCPWNKERQMYITLLCVFVIIAKSQFSSGFREK